MNYETISIYLAIGIGATAVLDIWAWFLATYFALPATNWKMVGRWIGHMKSGQFVQSNLAKAETIPFESTIGWVVHYLIGMVYGLILFAFCKEAWLEQPTILPALLVVWVGLIAPFFIMMPGMGAGIAGANLASPFVARCKSFVGHSVFGLGLYLTALPFGAN